MSVNPLYIAFGVAVALLVFGMKILSDKNAELISQNAEILSANESLKNSIESLKAQHESEIKATQKLASKRAEIIKYVRIKQDEIYHDKNASCINSVSDVFSRLRHENGD